MGKSRASLLSIVFQLFLITAMLANEEVRAVQKELRKRHLFLGDSTGETSPALTAAIRRYQQIKGFAPTGVIDWETAASLGIAGHTFPPTTPSVVDNKGNVRGPNGEALSESLPAAEERAAQVEGTVADPGPVPTGLPRVETAPTLRSKATAKGWSAGRFHPIQPRKETNPFVQALGSIEHARKFLFGHVDAKKKRRTGKRL